MGKWFYTDNMQICRKVKDEVFELVEFSEADGKYFLSERQKIILADWKDPDGKWDANAKSIIKSYYQSLEGLRACVRPEDEDQIVAEMIYECTSSLADEMPMTEKEAVEYLDKIVEGKEK